MPKSFIPRLPLDFSYQCCMEYEKKKPGHHWKFVEKSKWVLIERGKKKEKNVPLFPAKKARCVKKILKVFNKTRKEAPITTPEFLTWFLRKKRTIPCASDISIVLNNIVTGKRPKLNTEFEVITSVCDGSITVNVRGLPRFTPSWFYTSGKAEAYIAEYLFWFNESNLAKIDLKELPDFLEEIRFIRVFHKYIILDFKETTNKLRVVLRDNLKIVKYMRGQVCGCLPIPGPIPKGIVAEDDIEAVRSPEIVVSSPVIDKVLRKLSHIWQDKFAGPVLISAPPGSGKEHLSKSIPYGNGRPTENFKTISMADCDMVSLHRRLYGYEEILTNKTKKPGLIELAKDSAIFLDEIHQPGSSQEQSVVRASLLRTIEANKYYAVNGTEEHDVEKVLFIMATSIPLKKLKEYHPRDFWTRMTHAIEIQHPLGFSAFDEDDPTMSKVVSRFFNYFWWARIKDFYDMEPVFGGPSEKILSDHPNKVLVFWKVHSMTKVMGFKCENNSGNLVPLKKDEKENFPYRFAEIFNKCLSSHPNVQEARDFSIRGIRNMVTRLFSIAASNVERGQSPWKDKKDFIENVETAFREISQVADLG